MYNRLLRYMKKKNKMNIFFAFPSYLLFLFVLHPTIKSEIFTSTIHLEELVKSEAVLMKNLKQYIHAEEQRLNTLRRNIKKYKKESDKASENIEKYVSNPINAFLLIKRLTTDFKKVETLLEIKLDNEQFEKITDNSTTKFPNEKDLAGAAVGIMKLQHIYHLRTSSLAKGEIKGVKYSLEFSSSDCFELGKQLHNSGDYDYAQMWLDEAYSRFDYKIGDALKLINLQKYLASAKIHQKVVTHKNLQSTPQQNIKINEDISLLSKVYGIKREVGTTSILQERRDRFLEIVQDLENTISVRVTGLEERISKLCTGDISLSNKKTATLKCRYFKRNHPFLAIAPFKIEEAHLQPDILIFHNVLSDSEMATIKKIALPKLKDSQIFGAGKSFSRTAKGSNVLDTDHKLLPVLSQRISDMTGLSMKTAEQLSVINYGIGGLYEPHYDARSASDVHKDEPSDFGVRIATVLFYMSDVEEGGATIFPLLNVTVWPRKGTAIVWYNLLSGGDVDELSLHAGCPVLLGSKWVATKWIREKGQEILKPCGLEKDEPISFRLSDE